jgi:hypothetical protein
LPAKLVPQLSLLQTGNLIVHLKRIVATGKGNITAVAKGHLKKLKDFNFIYMILFCGVSVYSEKPFPSI